MGIRTIISATIACSTIFFTISCDNGSKDGCELEAGYSFRDSIRIFPDDEVISKSDTLWLSCEIPKKQIDLNSNKVVDMSNAENLSAVFSLRVQKGKNIVASGLDSFDVIIKKGTMVKHYLPEEALEILFEKGSKSYQYNVGLILKKSSKPAVYTIFYSEIGGVIDRSDPKICKSANISLGLKCKNQHIDLIKEYNPNAYIAPEFLKNLYGFGITQ
jgi:hypothetical protein